MSNLRPILARLIRHSYSLTGLYYVWSDWRAGQRFTRGDIGSHSGTLHESFDLQESLDYIQSVYDDYLRYSGCETLGGKVAEVGPGDNCGIGLLLLEGGGQSVDLVDRFYAHRNPVQQATIYHGLVQHHPGVARILDGASLMDETSFPGIHRYYGDAASAENYFKEGQGYDVILSRAVLEHVRDPLLALRRMTDALAPGGLLLHKVDLRDHDMFSGHHGELRWLEIPEGIYRRMSQSSGRPNRVLSHRYRSVLETLPLKAEMLITRLAGVGDIDPHVRYEAIPRDLRERALEFVASRRRHLASEFKTTPLEDLSVAGFFLVGRKSP